MYEFMSMTNAQSMEISSFLTSASMDSAMDITDSMHVPRSCSAVRSSSGMFSGYNSGLADSFLNPIFPLG